jgi:hypothetical protein
MLEEGNNRSRESGCKSSELRAQELRACIEMQEADVELRIRAWRDLTGPYALSGKNRY